MAKLSPVILSAQLINGIPASGAKLFSYAAGSSTKQATYTDITGVTPQANPIILDSRGEPASPIWLTEGMSYKFVFAASTDSDPPVSPIWDIDNVTGINDSSVTLDQWVASGVTPTYVSATQFTLPGDQTTAFQVNRRIKATVTAGTVYGYISASVFGALTTVTVVLDSGVLDSGLSAVQLGLITPTNTSIRVITSSIADLAVTNAKLANAYINDLTTVTLDVDADFVALADTSDSGNKKKGLIPAATTTVKGVSELATGAETIARTDPVRVVTPLALQGLMVDYGSTSLSGSSVDFTAFSPPSWCKRIIVVIDGLSTNGTSVPILQLGDSGGIEASGYVGTSTTLAASASTVSFTTGFAINSVNAATSVYYGAFMLFKIGTGNTWDCYSVFGRSDSAATSVGGGAKTLSATIDRLRLTTVAGVDTFDLGNANIFYE